MMDVAEVGDDLALTTFGPCHRPVRSSSCAIPGLFGNGARQRRENILCSLALEVFI